MRKPLQFGLIALILSVFAINTEAQSPDRPQPTLDTDDADARDEQMRELVSTITVRDLSDGSVDARTAELMPQPLVRYSDQQRRFPDATLWGWELDGRPVAFSKLERVVNLLDGNLGWQFCLVSLSEGLIDARWEGRESWRASKRGVAWNDLTGAPQPHRSENGRLVQMKALARQFEAVIINPELEQRERMRLLPTPILRYSSAPHNVIDAGIFGFTSKGTNPDTLLLIELQGSDNEPAWKYAVVGMTGDAVTVERGGQSVWTKDSTPGPGDYDNWDWRVDWDSPDSG